MEINKDCKHVLFVWLVHSQSAPGTLIAPYAQLVDIKVQLVAPPVLGAHVVSLHRLWDLLCVPSALLVLFKTLLVAPLVLYVRSERSNHPLVLPHVSTVQEVIIQTLLEELLVCLVIRASIHQALQV